MSLVRPRCNSLKPTKLPDETRAAPTPIVRNETANVRHEIECTSTAFPRRGKYCRGAVTWLDAMLLRKVDFGKGKGTGYGLLAVGYGQSPGRVLSEGPDLVSSLESLSDL
jgi:hypothetical protein